MSTPKKKPNTLAGLYEGFEALQVLVDLIASVVRKYPANTLPQSLKPFAGNRPHTVLAARPSSYHADELVLELHRGLLKDTTRIPGEWLNLHQSQVTVAVRKVYWADHEYQMIRQLTQLGKSIEEHEKKVKHHSELIEKARAEYKILAARIDPSRQRRRETSVTSHPEILAN